MKQSSKLIAETNKPEQLLKLCIKEGNLEKISHLHHTGYIQITDPSIETILKDVLYYGQLQIFSYFHQNGVDINGRLSKEALSEAVIEDHSEVLKYFHQNGAVFSKELTEKLALLCGRHGSVKSLEYLCQNGLFVLEEGQAWELLKEAARHENFNILSYVQQNGVDINERFSKEALSEAVIEDHSEVLKYFHRNGAVFSKELTEKLALLCGRHGSVKSLEYLCQNGLFVLEEGQAWELLKEAARHENFNILSYVQQNGVDINGRLSKEALSEAVIEDHSEVLKYFHQNGAVFSKELTEKLALLCGRHGSVKSLEYLCQNGLFVLEEGQAWELLKEAARHENFNILSYVQQNGVDINGRLSKEALSEAVIEDHSEVLKYFHQNGAVFSKELTEKLALLCGRHGSVKSLEYLCQNGLFVLEEGQAWELLKEAARHENFNILSYVQQNGVDINERLSKEALSEAVIEDHSEVLKYFHQNGAVFSKELTEKLALLCGRHGSVKSLEYLCQNGLFVLEEGQAWELLMEAARHENFNILSYVQQNGVDINGRLSKEALSEAVIEDHSEVLKYFHRNGAVFSKELVEKLTLLCGKHGSVKSLEYLCQNGLFVLEEGQAWGPLMEAARNENVNILSYFYEKMGFSTDFLRSAIIADHIAFIKYAKEKGFSFTDEIVVDMAILCATYGSLECLKFLHQMGLRIFQDAHIVESLAVEAVRNNNSNILIYLYKEHVKYLGELSQDARETVSKKNKIKLLDHVLTFFSFDKNLSSLIGLRHAFWLQGRAYFDQNIIRHEQKECLKLLDRLTYSFPHQAVLKWPASLKKNFQASKKKHQYVSDFENVLLFQNQNNIKECYFFTIKNGYIYTFHRLRKMFFFLISDQEIIEKAFEISLVNNQPLIFSFFMKNDSPFFKKKKFIRKLAEQVTQFCTLPTFEEFIKYYESLGIIIKQRLLYFAAKNDRLDIVEYLLSAKGASLNLFLKVDTTEFIDGPVRKLLADRRCLNELKGDLQLIHGMELEVLNDTNVFHPSSFWSFFNEVNLVHLKEYGFRNFKKNVNQNYFNFIPNLNDFFFLSILFLKFLRRIKSSGTYTLVDPDIINNKGELKEKYRRIFQKHRFLSLLLYKYTISNLWEYVKGRDVEELLEKLEEPRLGNPIEIRKDQKLISQDLASSVQEYYFMRPYLKESPLRIVEIGAGYGRLGYVLLNALKCKYIVFDIAPALYISQKYMTALFPDKKIFHFRSINSFEEIKEELEQSDIAFFTINQIKFFPENFCDFSINISSLHEMTIEQREKICEYMSSITKEFIYIKQYKRYQNPFDRIVIREKDYQFPRAWQLVQRRTTPTNIRFFEKIFHKKA